MPVYSWFIEIDFVDEVVYVSAPKGIDNNLHEMHL